MSNKLIEAFIDDELGKVALEDLETTAVSVNNHWRTVKNSPVNANKGAYVKRTDVKGSPASLKESKALIRVICSNSKCGHHVAVNPNRASLSNVGSKCSNCGSLLLLEK